jgi:flagellar protein FlbD
MIRLTKLDGGEITINSDLIESIEETPDTHITLMNGNRLLVLEKTWVIVERIITYKARIARRAETSHRQKYLKRRMEAGYRPHCSLDRDDRD